MTSLYLGVMDALYAINTNTIFFVEGELYVSPISSTFSDCCLWNNEDHLQPGTARRGPLVCCKEVEQ